MTVKELKEILDACNDDAVIVIACDDGNTDHPTDNQVFHTEDGKEVVFDLRYDKWADR